MPKSLALKVMGQLLGVGVYFALVVVLYWRRLTDLGAVAIILGLLFLFKTVVDSGAISIAHLSPSDPEFNLRSPEIELFKAFSFFGVGMGAWVDLAKAMQMGLVPPYLPAAVIHLMLVCIFAICVVCCFARYAAALKNRPRP
jgi:Na+/proline symporter